MALNIQAVMQQNPEIQSASDALEIFAGDIADD